ncbi:hypothetical protein DM860_008520 [Cuscuta australis]|uniref:O-fucosyltransferase family protein n=1 Tax=Cuscuta australis TaxID=267555 RepID=A0A328D4T8_9ASTE|nr:hypothetical protein DM860_008520 [Cuscuta australis]
MKGEKTKLEGGKSMVSKKMKWAGLVGLLVSAFSLLSHFLLARRTHGGGGGGPVSEFQSSLTLLSWMPVFDNADLLKTSRIYGRLWGPVRRLEYLQPLANPGSNYPAPEVETSGFIFVRIRGGFHEIRNSICDVVAVARLLNATLVIPEIQSTTSSKGISSEFKSFAYLYNEDQFMAALAKDVKIVKTLPKNLKGARRKKEIPSFRVAHSASPHFYLHHVLPVLTHHSVVELIVSDGGCLQSTLPPPLMEYQKLRCRVAFHALRFREEVQELAVKILNRLRASGRPFLAYDPGMTRDALAYYGCAELFQDVHTELILHRRSWMIKHRIVKGNLSVDSAKQRLNGLCPLMPEEVGILLRAYGYKPDTVIYISGGEIFGGRKKLVPLHAMFENVVDRTSLSTPWELSKMYGRETTIIDKYPKYPLTKEERKFQDWKTLGPRPRPLPPPPARPKYTYNIEGWWGWVAESDYEPESSVEELRTNAHKLLWEAVDYIVCLEADAFIAGFDRDGKGHPNFASLVMGHRLYHFAPSRTYRPNRKETVKLFEEIRDNLYQANRTWIRSLRKSLRRNLVDGFLGESKRTKLLSLVAFPVSECFCTSRAPTETSDSLGVLPHCPPWMNAHNAMSQTKDENDEDADEEDDLSSGLFFRQSNGSNREVDSGEMNNKEETLVEDQEELDGGER